MKLEIDRVLNPQAAGLVRAGCMLVVERDGGPPVGVQLLIVGDGQTVRITCLGDEAIKLGQEAIVNGVLVVGGMPPVVLAAPPPSPIVLNANGRND